PPGGSAMSDAVADQPILLVEDSDEDYQVTVRAFRKLGLANPTHHCRSGDEALDFLRGRGRYAGAGQAPRPGIVLLDLNLPGTDGREVLAEIKGDPALRRIPVVVLTTSGDQRDILSCYRAGANSYIKKPVNLGDFFRAIESFKAYWFET